MEYTIVSSLLHVVCIQAGDCQGETLTMEYTIVSSLLHLVSISMFLALCLKSLRSTDLGIQKNPVFSSVWLLVHSSQVGVPYHYAHMSLKTDTRQKISGDRTVSCTHVPT